MIQPCPDGKVRVSSCHYPINIYPYLTESEESSAIKKEELEIIEALNRAIENAKIAEKDIQAQVVIKIF